MSTEKSQSCELQSRNRKGVGGSHAQLATPGLRQQKGVSTELERRSNVLEDWNPVNDRILWTRWSQLHFRVI